MIDLQVLDEPLLEFGYAGTHQEQRAGVAAHGPADIDMEGRCDTIRVGLVGDADAVSQLRAYLQDCARGVPAKNTTLWELFPEFPGCNEDEGFHARLSFPEAGAAVLGRRELSAIADAPDDLATTLAAVDTCAAAMRSVIERAAVDVVVVARPDGVPEGVAAGAGTGENFHDLLKAAVIDVSTPFQLVRPKTWKGTDGVEDDATRAWNLFTALFYKSGGKPWRLHAARSEPTRCFVGVSFARLIEHGERGRLFASVAQVFNELGDGVIVRGAVAHEGQHDRQAHLSKDDADRLLSDALARFAEEHGHLPAAVTLHKTSAFSADERDGFLAAADRAPARCDLIWVSGSDDAMLIRGANQYPPLRGTLLTLDEDEHVLYTHGSVPYYRTYPGLYVPRPLGVRPCVTERPIEQTAREILALTKLNWNRARMEARWPITLQTARRVGEILRHVPDGTAVAAHYSKYM